ADRIVMKRRIFRTPSLRIPMPILPPDSCRAERQAILSSLAPSVTWLFATEQDTLQSFPLGLVRFLCQATEWNCLLYSAKRPQQVLRNVASGSFLNGIFSHDS